LYKINNKISFFFVLLFNKNIKKMNNVKNLFSIKDLENLSGIKAHTIRIWEKRYKILEPNRSETNIRSYTNSNLQKLLNIVLLHNFGYKISKIADLTNKEITQLVTDIISDKSVKNHAISSFKMAMMNFDQKHFLTTYNNLLKEKSFKEVFYTVFIPLMEEIGFLWQTNTISPAHEHFIFYLIKQKLVIQTEKVQLLEATKTDKIFILFLPSNEIHELGLMYLNYELLSNGYKTIYLGANMPIESLICTINLFDFVIFVSYFTVYPSKEELNQYINNIEFNLLRNNNNELFVLGQMAQHISKDSLSNNIHIFQSIEEIIKILS
jgi:DNA-binding transcriptional MerR regulator